MKDELDQLYTPSISDLELNEMHGKDREVIYLDDARRVLEAAKAEARREGKLEAARYFKNYMVSTSPFLDQIVEPYIASLTTPPQKENV
jgi:hypothetical protein